MELKDENAANQNAQGGAEQNPANQILGGGAQDTANQNADGSDQQPANQQTQGGAEESGLKAGLVAEQKKRQEAEAQAEILRQQVLAQQQQLMAVQQQSNIPEGPSDADYPTFGDIRREQAQVIQTVQAQMFRAQHTDMDDVVGTGQGPMFKPSETLKQVIHNSPEFTNLDRMISMGNPNAIALGYRLCKQQKELDDLRAFHQAAKEQQKLNESDNKINLMSSAAAGGGGGVSQANQIPDANTPEFDQFWNEIKSGKYDTVRS